MKIKDLEYYLQLVESKNFSIVAEKFNVRQPTITMAIKRLEEEYGTTFFIRDRVHHQIQVTETGLQFTNHVRTILNELAISRQEIEHTKKNKVLFGLPPIIGNYYFPAVTPRLLQANLLDRLVTVEHGSKELLQMLLSGKLDMALLGSLSSFKEARLRTVEFACYPFKIIMGTNHPLAQESQVSFADLKGQSFILPDTDFIHDQAFRQMCRSAHFRPTVIYRTNDIHIIKAMVEEGMGISFLAELAIDPSDRFTSLEMMEDYQPYFHLSLATRQTEFLSPVKQKLWETIRAIRK